MEGLPGAVITAAFSERTCRCQLALRLGGPSALSSRPRVITGVLMRRRQEIRGRNKAHVNEDSTHPGEDPRLPQNLQEEGGPANTLTCAQDH